MSIKHNLFKTLRGKIILSLLVLIILPVIFIVYNFYISTKDIVQLQLYQVNQAAVDRKAASMDELATRIVNASNLIMNDPDMEKFLKETDDWTSNYLAFKSFTYFQTKISNVQELLFLGSDAYLTLYDNRDYMYSPLAAVKKMRPGELATEPWYQPTLQLNGYNYWSFYKTIREDDGRTQNQLVMTRQLNSDRQRGYGMIYIGIPTALFFYNDTELHNQLTSGIHSLVINEDKVMLGQVTSIGAAAESLLSHTVTGDNGIKTITLEGEEYLVNDAYIPQLSWKLVQLISQKDFVAQLSLEKNKTIIWVMVWFVLFAIAFIVLMIRFTGPFKRLVKSMNQVGKGELNTTVLIKGEDEIAILGKNFNKMVLHLQELIENLSIEQQRKQKAQFQALQAQINPHFLLNTLNSIKWMAILSGSEHVSEMISKLGKLLNFTMKNEEEFVTLREELDYLQVYMSLQEIRYHDQISIVIEVPESLMDCELLKFTLQPAIENSIIHGNRFPLQIEIHAEEKAGKLLITLQDNGVGMSEETIQLVKSQLTQPNAKYSGIGIRNVNERIKLHFGVQYGIQIFSQIDQGVRIILELPLVRREANDSNIDRR
ncbi:cache domain-containing sensor histidine kinase [Paenibacillus psychroresistens]|nr:sensor histidine kinase [Paenibacillus psychroresistens]